jgi:hypothetical protein
MTFLTFEAPMKLVYIAHPLYGDGSPEWGNPDRNIERALRFMAFATNEGNAVISWAHHFFMQQRGLTPDGSAPGAAEFYLSRDKLLMEAAEELWVCGPPETSSGVRFEMRAAEEFQIPILMHPEWMRADFDPLTPGVPR